MNEVIVYQTVDGALELKSDYQNQTIWANRMQMAEIFDVNPQAITKHIQNIYNDAELDKTATSSKMELVQMEAGRAVKRKVDYYNLEIIISVGYRVNTVRGTKFRQWANKIVKDYLVQGYAINEKRLAQKQEEIQVLKNGISILSRVIEQQTANENWLPIFAKGLQLLDDYDHENLDTKGKSNSEATYPTKQDYLDVIQAMQSEFCSDVFAKEKDQSFDSSLAQIQKGFDSKDFYPSIEEKAAMLLYLVVKNHSFVDGNKRIAAACFLKFLKANNLLFKNDKPIISNDTLASLTLFIATSKTEEMETIKKIIVSILNRA